MADEINPFLIDWSKTTLIQLDYAVDQFSQLVPSGIHLGPHDPSPIIVPLQMGKAASIPTMIERQIPPLVELCNPMTFGSVPFTQIDYVPAKKAKLYLPTKKELIVVRARDVVDYAERLVEIAKWLNRVLYAGIIIPFRGGLKPGVQIRILTELRHRCCWLPFTGGSNKVDYEHVRDHLKGFLDPIAIVPVLRLVILDTADSGDSAWALADMIHDIYRSLKGAGKWIVDFILIFEPRNDGWPFPPKTRLIRDLTINGRLVFNVSVCQTPTLIAEDWDAALGIRTIWKDGKVPSIETVPSNGRVIVEEFNGDLREIEADRLDRFTDDLIAKAVSEAVTTLPFFRHQRDVWPKYVNRETQKLGASQAARITHGKH